MATVISAIRDATSGLLTAIDSQHTRSKPSPLSAKDSLAPKKAAAAKKKKAYSSGKFAAVGFREMSKGLNLTLPLRVAHRSCQRYMPRATATQRNHIIYGRHAAVTAISSIEYALEKIMRGAIQHAIRRDAKTVSLLDTQRSVITQPELTYSLRHASVAVTNAPNPQGIVRGMTIGLRNKKKSGGTTVARVEASNGKKQSAAKRVGKKPSAKSSGKKQTKDVEQDEEDEVDENDSDNDEQNDNDDAQSSDDGGDDDDGDAQSHDMETSTQLDNDADTSTDDNVEEQDLNDSADSFDGHSANDADDVSL